MAAGALNLRTSRRSCFGFQNSTWNPLALRRWCPRLVNSCLALSHKLSAHIANSIFCNYMLRPFIVNSGWRRCSDFWRGTAFFASWALPLSIVIAFFLVPRLKDFTVVNHVIILFIFSKCRFADFDGTCFYSLFIIIHINIICTWTYICLLTCHGFFIGAKRLIKPFLIIQTSSNGFVLMTF